MKRSKPTVFVVDDNEYTLLQVKRSLEKSFPCEVVTFTQASEVIRKLYLEPDFILSDYQLTAIGENGLNGEQLLILLKEKRPDIPVMMYSSRNSVTLAVRLMKRGASDFINSDFIGRAEQFATLLTRRVMQEKEKLHRKMLERQVTNIALAVACVFVLSLLFVSSVKLTMLPYTVLGFGLLFGGLIFFGKPSVFAELWSRKKTKPTMLKE